MYTYFISFFVEYVPEFKIQVFYSFNKVTTSLFEGFKQKEIFFNVTLITNTFYQNQSKKHYINHTRQLCISKDSLTILLKSWLNLTKVEN